MFKINLPTLNKWAHTGKKGQSSSLQFGPEAKNSSPQKNQHVTKCYTGPWSDSLE